MMGKTENKVISFPVEDDGGEDRENGFDDGESAWQKLDREEVNFNDVPEGILLVRAQDRANGLAYLAYDLGKKEQRDELLALMKVEDASVEYYRVANDDWKKFIGENDPRKLEEDPGRYVEQILFVREKGSLP